MKQLAIALLCWLSFVAHADVRGLVVGVSDGDTISLLDEHKSQHKIRLAGIDAPEKGQAFGQRSKEHLSSLVYRKQVEIVGSKIDRYGRTVGKVLFEGRDICLQQIEAGYAWHFKKYQREQLPEDRKRYGDAEEAARNDKRGLWTDAQSVPPWEWRQKKRDQE